MGGLFGGGGSSGPSAEEQAAQAAADKKEAAEKAKLAQRETAMKEAKKRGRASLLFSDEAGVTGTNKTLG